MHTTEELETLYKQHSKCSDWPHGIICNLVEDALALNEKTGQLERQMRNLKIEQIDNMSHFDVIKALNDYGYVIRHTIDYGWVTYIEDKDSYGDILEVARIAKETGGWGVSNGFRLIQNADSEISEVQYFNELKDELESLMS